jgi:hypothetical protein
MKWYHRQANNQSDAIDVYKNANKLINYKIILMNTRSGESKAQ